ncbi:hypothetical protein PR048_018539 [Dryococelus australis]|uniref:Uncharacterized protein n=1 Tax=Dryococelus australis TaxID=614101 RepID=A0ABQ9HCY8_9NEOP|nr:hypothetical protein PR048_018539 [Dryococelus australis]
MKQGCWEEGGGHEGWSPALRKLGQRPTPRRLLPLARRVPGLHTLAGCQKKISGLAVLGTRPFVLRKRVHAYGAAVAERLARSPPAKAHRARSPAGSPDFRKWESCPTVPLAGGSSRASPASPAPSLHRRSLQSPSSTLKTSLLRAAQISPLTQVYTLTRSDALMFILRSRHFFTRPCGWRGELVLTWREVEAEKCGRNSRGGNAVIKQASHLGHLRHLCRLGEGLCRRARPPLRGMPLRKAPAAWFITDRPAEAAPRELKIKHQGVRARQRRRIHAKQTAARLYSLMPKYADINCALVVCCHSGRQRLGQHSLEGAKHRLDQWLKSSHFTLEQRIVWWRGARNSRRLRPRAPAVRKSCSESLSLSLSLFLSSRTHAIGSLSVLGSCSPAPRALQPPTFVGHVSRCFPVGRVFPPPPNLNGATAAERLACSPPTKAIRVQSPAGSHRIFACGNRAVRCRWSAGFLGDLPFPLPSHSGAFSYSPQSPSSALRTSMLRAAQISSPNLKVFIWYATDVQLSKSWSHNNPTNTIRHTDKTGEKVLQIELMLPNPIDSLSYWLSSLHTPHFLRPALGSEKEGRKE